jgi:hypothetical protein
MKKNCERVDVMAFIANAEVNTSKYINIWYNYK